MQVQPSIATESDGLDLLTPVRTDRANDSVILDGTLAFARGRYACILLDLSGFNLTEAREVAAVPSVSIVLFVAQGQCSEFALAKARRRFPAGRLLGGILMEVASPNS